MGIDECLTDPKKTHRKKPWSKAWHRPRLQLHRPAHRIRAAQRIA
jgi:hypothetical protein